MIEAAVIDHSRFRRHRDADAAAQTLGDTLRSVAEI
jgi:hypothetical protein